MSGAYPTDPKFRAINFQDNRPTLVNQTLSGKKSARKIGGQYFSFTVQMPPMQQENGQKIFAFLQKQKGAFENFTIKYPLQNLGSDKGQTDIAAMGVHASQDATITMDGFTASTAGVLKAGDMIKFANHTKLYMVQDDVTSDGSGAATVSISPNLVSGLADNEAVTVNEPAFTVYLSTGEVMYSTDPSGFFSISFDVRELIA
jgi:hypothetical protein